MATRTVWRRWVWLAVGLVGLSLASASAQPAPQAPIASTDSPVARQAPRAEHALADSGPGQAASIAPPTPLVPNVQTDGTGQRLLPHDLSPWSMFLSADKLVKGVMLGLALASVVTWTIFIGKTFELGLAKRRLQRALLRTDQVASLAEARIALGAKQGLIGHLIAGALHELEATRNGPEAGVKERCASLFSDIVRTETQNMRRGMGLLATIGSTAPFVGLFGTVWGIMNAFIGISKAQTTNLAVVAPGIAEALLATAFGLVAAIPAVIVYNHFSQATRRYQFLVGRASGVVQRLLSRELDSGHARMTIRAAE